MNLFKVNACVTLPEEEEENKRPKSKEFLVEATSSTFTEVESIMYEYLHTISSKEHPVMIDKIARTVQDRLVPGEISTCQGPMNTEILRPEEGFSFWKVTNEYVKDLDSGKTGKEVFIVSASSAVTASKKIIAFFEISDTETPHIVKTELLKTYAIILSTK